jgi:hypothetical protein
MANCNPTPGDIQRRDYAQALEGDCPSCYAGVGEPCLPASLDRPHVLRVAAGRQHARPAPERFFGGVRDQ